MNEIICFDGVSSSIKKKICINGGGISGLMLAKLLKNNNNFEVDLYEKNKLGGRFNVKLINKDYIFTGAEYVHGEKSLMYELVKNYNLSHELIEVHCEIITDFKLKEQNNCQITNSININDYENALLLSHELCMNPENIDILSINHENKNWICGDKNYLMNYNIYSTIMNDLIKYPDNIYYNTSTNVNKLTNYDFIVNAYTPKKFKNLCHPAIKIFFTVENIEWDISKSILFGKKIMNIEVVEVWKNKNFFILFATGSRAKSLNELVDKNQYIYLVMKDILSKDVKINIIDICFHEYGYHYPFEKIVPHNFCGEWTSKTFDSSLSGAIKSAHDMYEYIVTTFI